MFEIEFSNKVELEAVCEKLAGSSVGVRAWGWKPEDGDKELQMHSLKDVPDETEAVGSPSF